MKLIALRHGETASNRDGIIQGQLDTILSEKGEHQAEAIGLKLKDEPIDIIISSDLERARHTAAAVRKHHPSAKYFETDKLRERNFGDLQGKFLANTNWSEEAENVDMAPVDGESFRTMAERIVCFINSCLEKYPNRTVLIVTHAGPIRTLRVTTGEVDFANRNNPPINNASIWRYEISKPLKIL